MDKDDFNQQIAELKKIIESKNNEIANQKIILQAIDHPIYLIDVKDLSVIYKNNSGSNIDITNKLEKCHTKFHNLEKPCGSYQIQCPLEILQKTRQNVILEQKVFENNYEKYYKVKAIPVFNEHGTLTSIVEQKIDITEEKIAKQNLIDSEAKYKAVIQQSADNIYLMDMITYKVLEANQSLQLLLGYSSDEMKNLTIFDFINHPKDDIVQKIEKMRIIERIYLSHRKYKTSDGRLLDVEVASSIIKYKGKQTVCVVSRDITNRIKIEDELRRTKENAEKANQLKSVIISNVSHELRTPLNGILGFTQLLLEECESPEQKEMLEVLEKSGKRLNKTINSLLALSELESDSFKMNLEILNFAEIVKTAIVIFEEYTRPKNITLIERVLDKKICAKVDEYLLNQVLYNIIQNSIKFTKRGYIKIEVDNEVKDGKIYAVIRIKDSGPGIPNEQLNLIFDAFRQGSEGIGRDFDGVGIGLTISKKMVEMMGGEIQVTSQLTVGSTFSLYFPAQR